MASVFPDDIPAPPKKRGRPPKNKNTSESNESNKPFPQRTKTDNNDNFLLEYDSLVEEVDRVESLYGMKFKIPKIKDEKELVIVKNELQRFKSKLQLEHAIDQLPLNWFRLTGYVAKFTAGVAYNYFNNPKAAARIFRLQHKLREEYSLIEPDLIELMKKYPKTQIQPPVELRLFMTLMGVLQEVFSDENIDNEVKRPAKKIPSDMSDL